MIVSQSHETVDPAGVAFHWSIELNGHPPEVIEPRPGTMTAAEEMFFLGSPLAHVVEYEDVQREKRFRALTCRSRAPADIDQVFAQSPHAEPKVLAE